jgi:hypothetical protein
MFEKQLCILLSLQVGDNGVCFSVLVMMVCFIVLPNFYFLRF